MNSILNDGERWRVLCGDAAETLRRFPPGWARAVLADPPGQLGMGGELWDQPSPDWIHVHALVLAAALYAAAPGAPGFVWAPPRTSHWTAQAIERAGWRIEDKVYVINASRRAPSKRHLRPAVDEWIKVRAPGAPIEPEQAPPWPRNAALMHDPACADACASSCSVEYLIRHAGTRKSGAMKAGARTIGLGYNGGGKGTQYSAYPGSTGTADRFFPVFRYQAPARGKLRDAFLQPGVENENPAAKPPELGAWLAGLISSPGDLVLGLYSGWGGLDVGALLAGRRIVSTELDPRSAEMTAARLRTAEAHL